MKNEINIRPKNHSYPLFMIQMALTIKLSTSSGFRAIQKILAIFVLYTELSTRAPSYTAILGWTKKMGYSQLTADYGKWDDWAIILDESIEFGHNKLLVIYGVRSSKIDFTRALEYTDLAPFAIISGQQWTGSLIAERLKEVQERYGKIIYAVADGGNAIKKALRLENIPHIYDITHKFAWFLKGAYKDDPDFQSYTQRMAKMRGSLSLSSVSHILPPNQRVNSRFMNLKILSDWGSTALGCLARENTSSREHAELEWVGGYAPLIEELSEINHMLGGIMHVLKTNGLSRTSLKRAKEIIGANQSKSRRAGKLKTDIKAFLCATQKMLPRQETVLCTSDIIESSFGKYKNYISNNPMVGITDLALCLAAFTSNMEIGGTKKAMENVKNREVKEWSKTNIGQTNLSRRKEVLKKTG